MTSDLKTALAALIELEGKATRGEWQQEVALQPQHAPIIHCPKRGRVVEDRTNSLSWAR